MSPEPQKPTAAQVALAFIYLLAAVGCALALLYAIVFVVSSAVHAGAA